MSDDTQKLKRQIRDLRRVIRDLHDAEWMVTADWCSYGERSAMWNDIAKRTGMRDLKR